MSDKLNNAAEEYLNEKRQRPTYKYEEGESSFFEKGIQAISTPFRWGAEALTSLFLRAQDSTLSEAEAYRLAQGNRKGKAWYETGDAPVTLGQSMYGAATDVDIDWTNSKEVQNFFSRDSQKFLSGGVDLLAGLFLDPLNYVGAGLGAKGLAMAGMVPGVGMFGGMKNLANAADVANWSRLESLSAKNFGSVADYFRHTQQAFLTQPDISAGLRIGTQAYKDEVTRLQPFFKGMEEFKSSHKNAKNLTPLSDTAGYLFDGTMFRAVDGEKFFTWSSKTSEWIPEATLSPQIAEVAKAQFSHSGFLDEDIPVKGFEKVGEYAKVRRIRTWDGQFLPNNLKFGVWRFSDNTENYIAWDSTNGTYWALSDKPIQERYLADDIGVVEDVSDYDAALWDTLDYTYKNNGFLSAQDFYNTNPELFYKSRPDEYEVITPDTPNFDLGRRAKYFIIDQPFNNKVYAREGKLFYVWDVENPGWTRIRPPKIKDSNKQMEMETRLREKRDGYIAEGDDALEDEFSDSLADEFNNEMDQSDEYLNQEYSNDDPAMYGREEFGDWLPEGMQRDDVQVELPPIGAISEMRWYPMDKTNIEEYGLAYRLRYIDQFGKVKYNWIPANLGVISRTTPLGAENAGKLAFPTAPLLRTEDNEVFTIGLDGSIIDINTAHRENELYKNFVLQEQYKRMQEEARLLPGDLPRYKQPETSKDVIDYESINAIRKQSYEQVTAQLNLIKIPTKFDRQTFEKVSNIVNDPTRYKPISSADVTPEEWQTYLRVQKYNELRRQQSLMARTAEEAIKDDEIAKLATRDAEIEDRLLSDPEYKVAAHEWFAQGKKGQRPITISFWYDRKLNEDGTYTITQMGRRTDFTGFEEEKSVLGVKEWEIFKWENVSVSDLKKAFYSWRNQYPAGLILPNNDIVLKSTMLTDNPKTFWDILSDSDQPVVTVNIDELDTLGLPENTFSSKNIDAFRQVSLRTGVDRLAPKRFASWEEAEKRSLAQIDTLVKRKSVLLASAEKNPDKYADMLKRELPKIDADLKYYRTYFRNQKTYEDAIIEGNIRREIGPSKPEMWFLNLEDFLNRVTGANHSVHRATVGFMGRDVARITPLTKEEIAAEAAMKRAGESQVKTKFPLERRMIDPNAEKKPLDIPIPEDIKAMGAKAQNEAIRKVKGKPATDETATVVNDVAPMSLGKVVRVKDADLNDPNTVYIGRPRTGQSGEFGNPFPVNTKIKDEKAKIEEVKRVVAQYKEWLTNKIKTDPEYANKIYALKGKTLACPGGESNDICHGQEILKAIAYLDKNPQFLGRTSEPSKIVIHSGGAEGADTEWAIAGNEVGIASKGYSFKGHTKDEGMPEKSAGFQGTRPALEERVVLTDEELLSNREELLAAGKNIHYAYNKFIPNGKSVSDKLSSLNRLIYRNAYQVNNSDAVIAVGRFAKRDNETFRRNVDGGTGWAVELGITQNKPVYFYDLDSNKWINFDYTQNDWVAIEGLPPTFENFAGIGTRGLTPQGKQAIRDYLSQFKKAE